MRALFNSASLSRLPHVIGTASEISAATAWRPLQSVPLHCAYCSELGCLRAVLSNSKRDPQDPVVHARTHRMLANLRGHAQIPIVSHGAPD